MGRPPNHDRTGGEVTVLRVGLTGGIGAGKSEVARQLARLGAAVIDTDQLAREAVAPGTDGLAEVVARFGAGVLDPRGRLDRSTVAAAVFSDEPARQALEEIIHPRVLARAAELATAAPPGRIVVDDVPLLVETGLAPTYHLVLVVAAAAPTRVARLTGNRGLTEAQAWTRIRAQAGDEARQAVADVVLTNDGPLHQLRRHVDQLWRKRLLPYQANLRARQPATPAEPLRPVRYDPSWPAQYRRLAARINHAVGDITHRLEHVGPTAVPGLAAVDVIDIKLTVTGPSHVAALAEPLAQAGFPRAGPGWCLVDGFGNPVHGSADPGRLARVHLRCEPAGR